LAARFSFRPGSLRMSACSGLEAERTVLQSGTGRLVEAEEPPRSPNQPCHHTLLASRLCEQSNAALWALMREQPLRESVAAIELPGLGPNAAASRRGFSNAVSRWMVIVRTPLHGWRGPTLAAIAGFSARQMGTCVGVNDVPGRVASKNAPAAIYSKNHPTFMGIFGVSLQMLMKSSPRRQPEVRMSMCPVLGTLGSIRIHRTCRIVAGLAACSASLPRKSKHGHTWPPLARA
jgi:hypothetical protein